MIESARWILRAFNHILCRERERDKCIPHAREGEVHYDHLQTDLSPVDSSRFLQSAGMLGGMAATFPAWASGFVELDLPGGPNRREFTTAFPQKGQMIL
jgi:hypothetical protein